MAELIMVIVALALPTTGPCEALAALDVVRAAAWAAGDQRLLASAYVPPAERREVEALGRWADRAITVDGARTVRSACHAVSATSVEVVERLAPATAVLPDGRLRALPGGSWTRRVIELERDRGWWRIARVR